MSRKSLKESEVCLVAAAVFKTVVPAFLCREAGSIPALSASLLFSDRARFLAGQKGGEAAWQKEDC